MSAAISSIVLFASLTIFMGVMGSWARGESLMDGEDDARQAMRVISDELREAMWVSVDADGMGVTYRKPSKDASGDFVIPVVWDGLDRRIELDGSQIILEESATKSRAIARNVLTVDPFAGKAHISDAVRVQGNNVTGPAYRIFTPNSGSVISEITVMVVCGSHGGQAGEVVRARKREVIALRNVPELIK